MRDSEELEQIKEARYEVLRPPVEHCRSTNNSLPPSGYSILPSRIFADARIGGAAIRVMGAVCCHANGRSGLAYPNQMSIAKRLGISQQGVSRQMVTLEKCGYLEKVIKEYALRSKGRKGATWRIIYDPGVTTEDVIAHNKPEYLEVQDAEDTINKVNEETKLSTIPQPHVVEDSTVSQPDVVPLTHNPQVVDKLIELKNKKSKREIATEICNRYSHELEKEFGGRGLWVHDTRQEAIVEGYLEKVSEDKILKVITSSIKHHSKQQKRPPYSMKFFENALIAKAMDVASIIKRTASKKKIRTVPFTR